MHPYVRESLAMKKILIKHNNIDDLLWEQTPLSSCRLALCAY